MNPSSPPSSSWLTPGRSWALLLIIAACLFFIGLGRLPLLEPDEGRNAEVAREMIVSHDWITPHYDSLPYLDKPVFLFWTIAGSFLCFGIGEFAARFPSALAALATVLLAGLIAKRMSDHRTALRAGLILATSPLFLGLARFTIFDMTLTFFVTVALLCFWLNGRQGFSTRWLDVIAFAAMGAGALTKGPVGFLIPLLVLVVFHALAGNFRELRKLHWASGWLVFLAVTLPWFIAVSLRNPGFPKYAFWEESLLRFATGAHLHRSQGFYYYIPVYLAGFLPWSFFLLFVAWNRLKKWRALRQEAHRKELFLLVWAGTIFVFFSVSHSKLPGYFLPALIPLSILTAVAWRELDLPEGTRPPDWLTAGFAVMIILGILMAASPQLLRFHGIEAHLTKKLPASVWALMKSSLFMGGVILAALGFLGRNMVSRSRKKVTKELAFGIVALAIPLLMVRWILPLSHYFDAFSSRHLAQAILDSPQREMPVYGYYYFRTSLPFYLKRPVGLVTSDGDEITSNYVVSRFEKLRTTEWRFPGAPGQQDSPERLLIDAGQLRALSRSAPGPFLLMVQNNEIDQALSVAG
ncbi:MAG TPA: phospholipid carrier-dependent glycosyltransferase, partial [Terriglobia bacterium]|nr:phospholipid carrier-dependent glycosyltransferase [Terriglobia bacterium]